MIAIYMLLPGCNLGPFRALLARMADRRGSAPDNNGFCGRKQAGRVYYGAVFEAKKEIPAKERIPT